MIHIAPSPRSPAPFAITILLAAALFALSLSAQADNAWHLDAQTWSHPRTAARVAQIPAIQAAAQAWAANPERVLVIRHAGDEAGELWATELEEWLIALGIAGDHIEIRPGGEAYTLELF
ncbi:MAG TPA: hypothetical protein VFP95_00465, partial [Gammaproteobacteria bacterium]|nr:hypothetical protein [Gammaproteobacteria bacterium]